MVKAMAHCPTSDYSGWLTKVTYAHGGESLTLVSPSSPSHQSWTVFEHVDRYATVEEKVVGPGSDRLRSS